MLDASPDPAGPAIVVGSKRAPGSYDGRSPRAGSRPRCSASLLRAGFGLTVSDTHGMKVVNLEALRPVVTACRSGNDLFDTELVIRAERSGYRVAEVPVMVIELRPPRTSIFRRVPRTLVGLAKLRLALAARQRSPR